MFYFIGKASFIDVLRVLMSSQGSERQINYQKLLDFSHPWPFTPLFSHSPVFPFHFPYRLLFLCFSLVVKLMSKNPHWFGFVSYAPSSTFLRSHSHLPCPGLSVSSNKNCFLHVLIFKVPMTFHPSTF